MHAISISRYKQMIYKQIPINHRVILSKILR